MRRCKAYIENIPGSPYSQSRQHFIDKLDRESPEDYDIRTWRQHCTVNEDGIVSIPSMGLKQCLDKGAVRLGEKVPGRRNMTYAGFFAGGVICDHDVAISNGKPLTPDDGELCMITADVTGKPGRGGGSRVLRRYPNFSKWHGIAEFTVIDDVITPEVFERAFKAGGMIVGIGRFRPENRGRNGRFRLTKIEWENIQL